MNTTSGFTKLENLIKNKKRTDYDYEVSYLDMLDKDSTEIMGGDIFKTVKNIADIASSKLKNVAKILPNNMDKITTIQSAVQSAVQSATQSATDSAKKLATLITQPTTTQPTTTQQIQPDITKLSNKYLKNKNFKLVNLTKIL